MRIIPTKLQGKVTIPPSKSLSHRAIICASLADGGVSQINNVALSEDIKATIRIMTAFGADIQINGDKLTVRGTRNLRANQTMDCNESGTALRVILPLALHTDNTTFTGAKRLMERPLDSYYSIFDKKDVRYSKDPLTICGGDISGEIQLDGSVSSQFLSGLLFALPLYKNDSKINLTTPLESKGYVDLTIDILRKFGVESGLICKGGQIYMPADYTVEGDYSQSAFFLVANELGNDIDVEGLHPESLQGDRAILDVINDREIDASQIPDLVPILAVRATFNEGETTIYNAARLRIKESDRLAAITAQINALSGKITEYNDKLVIQGVDKLCGGTVDACNDHRIAMALAIAATCADGDVVIDGAECVAKSYPNFWEDYRMLGGNIYG